jgi:ribonucleoside-diphosphate reductase alpha chain
MQTDSTTRVISRGRGDEVRGEPMRPSEDAYAPTTMRVTKRNGSSEPVDLNKIVRAVSRSCVGLSDVDALRVATKTISGLYDGARTRELDQLSIQTAAALIVEEPQYARLAARLLSTYIDKEVRNQEIHAFSQSIAMGHKVGLVNDRLHDFVLKNARKLNDTIQGERDREFEYFGLRTLYDRYLLKHPTARLVLETPQQFFLRIACALSENVPEAVELYRLFSSLEYLPSSPTLFNSGTRHEQLSSCFLLDSPEDNLESIYRRYTDVAMLSKFSGGIGLAYHRVRGRGSLISSTNGHSNGIVPWLKTLDASVAAVNQGGKRKGAACVYLEPWHLDIDDFLSLRDNTGDEASRTHNLNLANWVPDLFMRRVESDAIWSLFDPKDVPDLTDLYGEAFEARYAEAERLGLAKKTVKARDLYARMMRTLAQTGNGWMTFKDKSNKACNQTALPGRTCAPVEPVHGDHRGHLQGRGGGVQPRLDQPVQARGGAERPRVVRLRQAGPHGARRRAPARSGDRPELLPHRRDARLQPALAPGGPGRDGAAGRVLPAAPGLRRARGARAVAKIAEQIYFQRCRPPATWPRRRAHTRPSARRARRAASCSSTRGA